MLSQLFRPKWQHNNPEIRKSAITKIQDEQILMQLALSDNDSSVREAAIQHIHQATLLTQLLKKAKTEADKHLAAYRWVITLTGGLENTNVNAESFIIECMDEDLLLALLTHSKNDSIRALALGGLKNQSQLLNLLGQSKNSRIWPFIAETLLSESALKQALQLVSGRDKKTQHIIKSKLDAIKLQQTQEQAIQNSINQLIDKLTHLLQSESNPLFEGILLNLEQQYSHIQEHCSNDHNQKIQSLIKCCQEKQTAKKPIISAPEEVPTVKHTQEELKLITELTLLLNNSTNIDFSTDDLQLQLTNIQNAWGNIQQVDEKSKKQFNALLQSANTLLDIKKTISSNIQISHINEEKIKNIDNVEIKDTLKFITNTYKKLSSLSHIDCSAIQDNLHTAEILLNQEINHRKANVVQLQSNIKKWLDNAEESLSQKQLKEAKTNLDKAKEQLLQLDKSEAHAFQNALQRIYAGIKTLENWKNDANDEKRKKLIDDMRKLLDPALEPESTAKAIKQLQTEWKQLGHCPQQTLWQEFKQLSDTAYLPCQAYFDKLKQLREFNAQQKQAICHELEQFLQSTDWLTVDWRGVEKIHSGVQNEWKKFNPVERDIHQTLNTDFFALCDQLKEKLNTTKQQNSDRMKAIVSEAEALLEKEDISSSIQRYTALQQQWKLIGISHRNEQQQLWNALKKSGDALYEKRQNARHEANETKLHNLTLAENLIEQLVSLSAVDSAELIKNKSTIEQIKHDFKALGALPKENYKPCQDKFYSACEQLDKAVASAHIKQKTKRYTSLQEKSDELIKAESNIQNQDLFSAIESPTILLKQLLDNSEISETWLVSLSKRYESNSVDASTKKTAQLLCIETEVLAGLDVPTQDIEIKLQWQMEKLQKGFGQSAKSITIKMLDDLFIRWYSIPCWNKTEYKTLEKRFLIGFTSLQGKCDELAS